jgi:cyclophilin family peptidyl-prolyl cis-trans isomerase
MLIVILFKRTPSLLLQTAFLTVLICCAGLANDRRVEALVQLPVDSSGSASVSQSSDGLTIRSPSNSPVDQSSKTVHQKGQRYKELVAAMREQIRLITEANFRFYLDGVDQSYDWKDQWEAGVDTIIPLRTEFEDLATDLFINHANDPALPASLEETMFAVRNRLLKQDQDEKTIAVLKRLVEIKPDSDQLKFDLGLTLLKTNQFAQGNQLIDSIDPDKIEKLRGADSELLPLRRQLETVFEQEQKMLTDEADDDLPRVELVTTEGPIVVELFENQAPDTVGNFIHLVESGFYTDVVFHRVISGFMAQTGMIAKPGDYYAEKEVGYTIYDEIQGGRSHFYGYLSMAKTSQPDSGSSQFFITYKPTVFLDGRHTVFGRVIQGMDSVGRLDPTFVLKTEEDKPPKEIPVEGVIPDRILSAKVIRKRSHSYQPNKVEIR